MDEYRTEIRIPASHPAPAGHFPGHPVVPGVVILEQVAAAARQWLGARLTVRGFPGVKFTAPLLPEQAMQIALQRGADRQLRFRCTQAERLLAQGTLQAEGLD